MANGRKTRTLIPLPSHDLGGEKYEWKDSIDNRVNISDLRRKKCGFLKKDGSVCGKTFKTNCDLVRHEKTHCERDLQCSHPSCDKKFLQKSHLVTHEATHTKQMRFRCEACKIEFSDQSSACRHQKKKRVEAEKRHDTGALSHSYQRIGATKPRIRSTRKGGDAPNDPGAVLGAVPQQQPLPEFQPPPFNHADLSRRLIAAFGQEQQQEQQQLAFNSMAYDHAPPAEMPQLFNLNDNLNDFMPGSPFAQLGPQYPVPPAWQPENQIDNPVHWNPLFGSAGNELHPMGNGWDIPNDAEATGPQDENIVDIHDLIRGSPFELLGPQYPMPPAWQPENQIDNPVHWDPLFGSAGNELHPMGNGWGIPNDAEATGPQDENIVDKDYEFNPERNLDRLDDTDLNLGGLNDIDFGFFDPDLNHDSTV